MHMKYKRNEHRLDKINRLIKEEVGKIILKELDMDRNMLVTITQVKTSSDLARATIFFSTLDAAREQEACMILEKSAGDIQFVLHRKLRMRPVPRIRFSVDAGAKVEQRLYDILSPSHNDHGEIRE